MADQNRDEQNTDSRNQNPDAKRAAEQDDVAQDRNLSGASTWLNLPDQQPRGDADQNDTNDRQSNR